MKHCLGKRTFVILIVSLLLANRYVEYGRRVKASETETEWITEAEGGTETAREPETESEAETERESETEPESETETESETGAETDENTETERESESESDPESDDESETEPETDTETETEAESDGESETEPETDAETETEDETDHNITILHITNIHVILPEGGRIYDGTDRIQIGYDVQGEMAGEMKRADAEETAVPQLECEAHLAGSDVGTWNVEYRFSLPKEQENYQLDVEDTRLTAKVLPKELTVNIPDGWKVYGTKVKMENIHLNGKVEISGFVADEEGQEIIPEGFEAPEVGVDERVVNAWSDIYEKGRQKIYQNALVIKTDKRGNPTGNATANYVFPQEYPSENYHTGSLLLAPAAVNRGEDYEVRGDEGNYYAAKDGTIWLRRGSNLYVYPLNENCYSEGMSADSLQQSGMFSFVLRKRNETGEVTAESLEETVAYRVDGEVTEASVTVENVREEDGVYYGKDSADIVIHIPEDFGSGMKTACYFVAGGHPDFSWGMQEGEGWWQDCMGGTRITLTGNGTFVLYVKTEDYTGNEAIIKSAPILLDNESPRLTISGAENNSANAGNVALTVHCEDTCYRPGTLQVEITGANGGQIPEELRREEDENGAEISFADFSHEKASDDIYVLRAAAEDLAGNRTEESISFSVNRFGSVYDLAEVTKEALESFYHRDAFPIVFLETNIDYVGKAQIFCRKDGEVRRLQQGKEYTTERSGGKTAWKRYSYTVGEPVFAQEGTYEILLLSEDRAENTADNQTQKKAVRFAIDRTPPECLITGLEKNQVYHAGNVWTAIEVRDNGRLKEVRIYMDGQCGATYSGDELRKDGGIIKWKAEAKEFWQRLQVYAIDEAGNESWTGEIPFYVTERESRVTPYRKTEKSARELQDPEQRNAQDEQEKYGLADTAEEPENRAMGNRLLQMVFRQGNGIGIISISVGVTGLLFLVVIVRHITGRKREKKRDRR